MRPRRISLLDIGLDPSFTASMDFVESLIENINAGQDRPVAEVSYIRSRDADTITAALYAPADVLHIMSHGDNGPDGPMLHSDDGEVYLFPALEAKYDTGRIQASTLIVDACRTSTKAFRDPMTRLLEQPATYVGTSRRVGWLDGTVFCAGFYSALLQRRGRGVSSAVHAQAAAERAIKGYTALLDRPCPYTVHALAPRLAETGT